MFLNNNVSICSVVLFAFHSFYFQTMEPNYMSRSCCRFRSCVPTSLLDGETLGWLKRSQSLIFLFLMFLFLRCTLLSLSFFFLRTVRNATARPMPPPLPHLVFLADKDISHSCWTSLGDKRDLSHQTKVQNKGSNPKCLYQETTRQL